jgi:hypothetical protein
MADAKRVFILGAGFSKPAKMPLATELLPALCAKQRDSEMREWLDHLQRRMDWLSGCDQPTGSFRLNIEEVFHRAQFDIEVHRLRQHKASVGRGDGPGTSSNVAEAISAWVSYLERDLCDVIFEKDSDADLEPIRRWAKTLGPHDSVLTFNYDTLVERALTEVGKSWNHGMPKECGEGIAVFKLHGSIDWIVAHRNDAQVSDASGHDLLFDKQNENRRGKDTGDVEDDCRLWRCRTREQLQKSILWRDLQGAPIGWPKTVGIAGLGMYKQLHRVPGLVFPWARGMNQLYNADLGVVVGFSMSEFDTMAQMQFAEVAMKRQEEHRPLSVTVIDRVANETTIERFRRVFRFVEFVQSPHEAVDWNTLLPENPSERIPPTGTIG